MLNLIQLFLNSNVLPVQASTGFLSLSGVTGAQGLGALLAPENQGFAAALVALAGFFDGINVCSLSLIILLLGHILSYSKSRREAVKMGLIYTVTIFLIYVLAGLALSGLFSRFLAWPFYSEVRLYVNYFFIGLLILFGILNVHDFFFHNHSIVDIGKGRLSWFTKHLKKLNYSWTVLLGIAAVVFMTPCSLPIYLGSIGLLSQQLGFWQIFPYVLLYAFMFVLPMLVVVAISVRTEWFVRRKNVSSSQHRWLHLLKAVIQFTLAGLLIFI